MKLAANAGALGEALALCATRDKKMPALAQLTADGPAVSIASGDGNIAIKATVAATLFEAGAVAVSPIASPRSSTPLRQVQRFF